MKKTKLERVSADADWYEPYKISLATKLGNLSFVSGPGAAGLSGGGTGDSRSEA